MKTLLFIFFALIGSLHADDLKTWTGGFELAKSLEISGNVFYDKSDVDTGQARKNDRQPATNLVFALTLSRQGSAPAPLAARKLGLT
jgi:hypothetical protein